MSTCGKQRNGRGDAFFCICREWFCDVVFGKDIVTGPRPQNWFWLLWGNRDMDPLLNMYFHVTYPMFNALYDLARNCLSVLSSVTRLHVAFSWFPFSNWSSTFSSVVQAILGGVLRLLWSTNVSMVTKKSSSKYVLPLHTQSRFQVHLDYTYEL